MDSLTPGTAFNQSRYPVVDPTGRPFTPGCRVNFVVSDHSINRKGGIGSMQRIDEYGGIYLLSDDPLPVRDRVGNCIGMRHQVYAQVARHHTDGPYAEKLVTQKDIGNRHETGLWPVFIKLAE